MFVRSPEPLEYSYDECEDGTSSVVCKVGEETVQEAAIFIHAALNKQDDDGYREFILGVTVSFADIDYIDRCFSGLDTKRYVSEPVDREFVLQIALTATHLLLDTCKPSHVLRFTSDAFFPSTALRKHIKITEVFERCGYDVTALSNGSSLEGRCAWVVHRR